MLSVFEWFVLVLWCDAFVLIVLSDESGRNQGRGLVDRTLLKAPPLPNTSNFMAGRPKAALLFWFFYPLAQQSCGGDIGSVPYVCM